MAEPDDDEGAQNVQIPLRVTARVAEYLDDLIKTGAYGHNRTAVVRQLVMDGIRKAFSEQHIQIRRKGS